MGVLSVWRRQRDSNPRGVAPKRFSRPPRYDRFDTSPFSADPGTPVIIAEAFEKCNKKKAGAAEVC